MFDVDVVGTCRCVAIFDLSSSVGCKEKQTQVAVNELPEKKRQKKNTKTHKLTR